MEIVVTIFLISVTLALFYSTANSIILNRYGRYKEIALRIADKQVQTLRTTEFGFLPTSGSFTDPMMTSLPSGQGSMTITEVNPSLKEVTVEVSWRGPDGTQTQEVSLHTYITYGGLGQ